MSKENYYGISVKAMVYEFVKMAFEYFSFSKKDIITIIRNLVAQRYFLESTSELKILSKNLCPIHVLLAAEGIQEFEKIS